MTRKDILQKVKKTRLPFVVVKSAQSLDGKIATASGQSKWITSKETRLFSRRQRARFDAILAGINTVLKDNPSLSPSVKKKNFKKIILDTRLRISPRAKLFQDTAPEHCIVVAGTGYSRAKYKQLTQRGVNVVVCPVQNGRIKLKSCFRKLADMGVSSLLIEGGAQVIGEALKAGLVDMAHIYIAPKIFGDAAALNSVAGLNVTSVNKTFSLKNITIKRFKQDLLVQGYVYRNR